MRLASAMFALVLAAATGISAHACSCVRSIACYQVPLRDTMFVGHVISVRDTRQPAGESGRFYPRRVFRFEAAETFSVNLRSGDQIEVETGIGGGDCGYHFQVGGDYLVDAFRSGGTLSTGICSATAPVLLAHNTIQELRSAFHGGPLPAVSGIVERLQTEPNAGYALLPISGVEVSLTSSTGEKHQTVTDGSGTYSFARVQQGKHVLAVSLPPGLTIGEASAGKAMEVEVPPATQRKAACHVDVIGRPVTPATDR